ncbi:HupE/UreJ family protein [Actinoplanes oblitus]|uniref:HupE/UreJ family protein n=1 Tax=Actinoplanes oblitus TaxID=3040509 RepID=A0ABY8WBJ1_9ACTN|nr:HupE/UreJ family protein [Actinoplanes oblitus]WIM93764.1 HupE/UreJ family protein [Actinoplanes oblitus]
MIRSLLTGTMLAALVFGASPAGADPMPDTVISLDVHPGSVVAELRIPAQDLTLASGIDLAAAPSPAPSASAVPAASASAAERVRVYLAAHFRPAAVDGRAWRVRIGKVAFGADAQRGSHRELTASATLTPPPGGDVRHFRLGYDAVIHQVVTHTILVSVRADWAAGRLAPSGAASPAAAAAGGRAEVGVIRVDPRTMTVPDLTVDLAAGSAWRGFLAMVRLGGQHILAGPDHLLFLLVLLLPAALRAHRGRWRGQIGPRRAARRIAAVTLAFTVGHSVALAASALGHARLPVPPIEAFIAASVLVSALHAIRPLFPDREALVACLFGLGHGMAFSVTLAEMRLSTGQLALSLLGFNLGIEAGQLLLVALALPALVLAVRLPIQPQVRVLGASGAALAAAGWLADRLGWPNPVGAAADRAGAHPVLLLIGLVLVTVAAAGWALLIARRQVTPKTV